MSKAKIAAIRPEPSETTGLKSQVEQDTPAAAWSTLAVLTVLQILVQAQTNLPAAFANWLVPALDLSNTQFVVLIRSSGFSAALLCLFMGAVADSYSRPRLIAVGVSAASLLTITSAAANRFVGVLLPRFISGLADAVLQPAAVSLIAELFPPMRLATAIGIFGAAGPLGIGAIMLLSGLAGESVGWRRSYCIVGALVFAAGCTVTLLLREPRPASAAPCRAADLVPRIATNLRLARRVFRGCPALRYIVAAGTVGAAGMAASDFTQLWLTAERGVARESAALYSGVVKLTAAAIAHPVQGWLADQLEQRARVPKLYFQIGLNLVKLPIGLAMYLFLDPAAASFWVVKGLWALVGAGPALMAALQELSPKHLRGSIMGIRGLITHLLGSTLGAVAAGLCVDLLTARGHADPLSKTIVGFLVLGTVVETTGYGFAAWRFMEDKKWVETVACDLR